MRDRPPSRRALLGALSAAPLTTGSALRGAGSSPVVGGSAGVTPEAFGATGDGVTDDSAALQRAFDAVVAQGTGGVVILQPRVAYRCDTGLVLDASFVSLWGQGLLDFARCRGTCLTVAASSVAAPATPANNYGHRGMIAGALRLRGGGAGRTAIGVLFDSAVIATAAQLLIENLSVSECTTGIEFARRAYNNVFVRCDIFQCGTCVRWREADDNGERNTLFGCTLYNSATAVHLSQAAAGLYLESCSIDYTTAAYVVERGMVFATDCHHESSRWAGRPFRCAGDGATIHLNGGVILGQGKLLASDALFEAGAGGSIRLDGLFVHDVVLAPTGSGVTAWATGAGAFHAARCESFNASRLPARLHDERTMLADPDFAARDWQDPVWRLADAGAPIATRHGAGTDTLVLQRTTLGGETALAAVKRSGAGGLATLILLCLPVRPGDQVLAGFQVRRDPRRPGRDVRLAVAPNWARIDGHDAARVPVVTRLESTGVAEVDPTATRYTVVAPMASRSNRTAPPWATHFLMVVDLTRADQASVLFRGLWCDTI